MTEDSFVEPTPLPDGTAVIYSKIENHSTLYQIPLRR
jgi:hypothetical protein